MKTLSDLSNELLGLVLDTLHPRDLEAFFSTCKEHRQRGAWLLERHYLFKRTYSTFTYHKDIRRGAPARLLRAIWNDPQIADYVFKVDIEGWDLTFHGEGASEAKLERPPYTTKDLSLYENALRECEYVDGAELPKYLSILSTGDEEPIIMLLLLSLPNLENLRFASDAHEGADMFRSITERRPTGVLTRLTTAHLRAFNYDLHQIYEDFETLDNLYSLSSMKEVSFHGFASDPGLFEDFCETDSYINIPVESMTFSHCAIGPKNLFEFLSRCDNLTTFNYSAGPDIHTAESYSPFWIRAGLQTHCQNTLKHLLILSKDQPQSFMGSLKAFNVLEDVTTDLRLLIGNLDETIRTLPDRLPSSIRSVDLHVVEYVERRRVENLVHVMDLDETPELEQIKFIRLDGSTFPMCKKARGHCSEDWGPESSSGAA